MNNQGGSDANNGGNLFRYFNANTGVFQIQLGGAVPNGAPAENGFPQGYIQGQIVGWNGDFFLIKLYGNIDLQTGQLSDPLTASDGPTGQAAYMVMSAEDMTGTDGIPTSGATFGQSTDPETLAGLTNSLGVYAPIPPASVDASGMVDAVGNALPIAFAGWVAVTVNGDGIYNATMSGIGQNSNGGYKSLDAVYNGWGLDIVSAHPGGILEIGKSFSPGGSSDGDLGFGQIIGWNANGVLLEMYSNYSNGVLSNLQSGFAQFLFISENSLAGTSIPTDAPQVFGQDPSDFPPDFGLAPPAPPSTVPAAPIDPNSLTVMNGITFPFPEGNGSFSSGRIVLADATQNANGSYTLSLSGGEPWAGSVGNNISTDVNLAISVDYADPATGAMEFSFAATDSGATLPTLLDGEFFGKIVGWDGSDVLIQLYQNLDEATGVLSNPVNPSQGPAYMLISATDFANVNASQGSGTLDGQTFGQPSDASTYASLSSSLGISQYAAPSAVDLSGLATALDGQSSDFGAFVDVTNQGGGNFSATDQFQHKTYGPPSLPYFYAYRIYSDFTETQYGADATPGFTIKIDNVFTGGAFEWELDNPNPAPNSNNLNPDGPVVVDHFFAKVIGYNADGILVQNYTGYSNGQFNGPVSGVQEYAYFSTDNLRLTDIQDTPAQFGQDPSQLPTALGVSAEVPCFAAGTRLRTPRGDVAVESLRAGDLVVTASGEFRPVKWIGHRDVDCVRHAAPEKVWPVRVAAHAFGANLPVRDLYLSPDHALFVGGVLIPVKQLINHDTVEQRPVDAVTYYHVELDRHDVLLAEGLPAESFLDTGNRIAFANGGGVTQLHPDFVPDWASLIWEAKACARLVVYGPELEAARAQLRRAAAERAVLAA